MTHKPWRKSDLLYWSEFRSSFHSWLLEYSSKARKS